MGTTIHFRPLREYRGESALEWEGRLSPDDDPPPVEPDEDAEEQREWERRVMEEERNE